MVRCMDNVLTPADIHSYEALERQLREWDWQADLELQERSIPWLARKTGKSQRSVYAYRYGQARPTSDWLRDAYRVLRGG